ncbi:class I SAM-dependent methyltransferase [Pseudomonas machongensis]
MTAGQSPFPVSSFERLAALEANNWWFRARNNVLIWALRKHVGNFSSFLEIGCGTGFVLEGISKAFPAAQLHGSEYFREGLVHAEKRIPQASFSQLDATRMTDVEQYEVIGAFDVIEHIEDDQKVLDNLACALKPGGALVVSVPQHRWLWSQVDEYACHQRRYTRDELVEKIGAAGLKVEYTTSFVSLLVPLMWLSRLSANRQHKAPDYNPENEFLIPGWLNACLAGVMRIELGLIKLGLRLPVGGSVLAIARKA